MKVAVRLLILMSTAAAASGCTNELCRNTIVRRLTSPDGALEAVLFERNCGATTDFSTQVSVIRTGDELPDSRGNLFVADRDPGKAPAARWGGPTTEVEWEDGRRLVVRYSVEARVFRQDTIIEVAGHTVQVAYERTL